MKKNQDDQDLYFLKQALTQMNGEIIVRCSLRKVQIENIIIREGGLPTLFVAKYLDSAISDQYLFHKEELTFPKNAKLPALAG